MLQLILGTAGTGKTKHIIDKMANYARNNEKCMLITPEQFSKTMEVTISAALSNTSLNLAKVFSFSSLQRDVESKYFKSKKNTISAAGKAVFVKKAINNVENSIQAYSKQKNNLLFSYAVSEVFDEFKRSGVIASELATIINNDENSSEKLREISLIYAEYNGLLSDNFCDSEDVLMALSQNLPNEYTSDTHIFIDSFESFSHAQLSIIQTFLRKAKSVTISFTADKLYDDSFGTSSFSFTQKTAKQIVDIAKKEQVKIYTPIILEENYRFKSDDLTLLDKFLQGKNESNIITNDINATIFDTQYQEVSYICAQIHNLIKQGYVYNDIAVVCPQIDVYENQIIESFNLANIPLFIDQNRIITSSVPVLLFKTIFDAMANGINTKTMIALLKTDLTFFDIDVINALENYFYIWQDYKFNLQEDFSLPINGLQAKLGQADIDMLEKFNNIKNKLLEIFSISQQSKKTGEKILSNAFEILEQLGCTEKLTSLIENLKETDKDYSDLLLRQWESVISTINELYDITFEDIITEKEMQDLFFIMISGVKIGFAPQTQDCVMVTTQSRMKLDDVKVVFVVGAAQDNFPMAVNSTGVISTTERDFLQKYNFNLSTNFDNMYSFENLYFYKTLTTPSDKLYISCAKKNITSTQNFSSEILNIINGLGIKPSELPIEDYAISYNFFTEYIGENIQHTTRDAYLNLLMQLRISPQVLASRQFNIDDINYLQNIIGNQITISPTGAESYFQCPFTYFLQRLLKLRPLEKITLDARLAGEYLHYIAHNVMENYGEDFYKADWNDVLVKIDSAVNEYIDITYPKQIISSPQFAAQHINMRQNASYFLKHIHNEQQESLFRPVAFEKKIGLDDTFPPLKINYEDKVVNIVGVCDRIDLMQNNTDNYLRIVDYKTGTKAFSLNDVYNGLSSQLLLYMSALLENKFLNIENLKPAAVLYQQADTEFKFDKNDEQLYKAVGMAVKNSVVSQGFDTSYKGKYGLIKGEEKIASTKGSEVVDEEIFNIVLKSTKDNIANMAKEVYSGNFDCMPLDNNNKKPCSWCSFKVICQNNDKARQAQKHNFKSIKEE